MDCSVIKGASIFKPSSKYSGHIVKRTKKGYESLRFMVGDDLCETVSSNREGESVVLSDVALGSLTVFQWMISYP